MTENRVYFSVFVFHSFSSSMHHYTHYKAQIMCGRQIVISHGIPSMEHGTFSFESQSLHLFCWKGPTLPIQFWLNSAFAFIQKNREKCLTVESVGWREESKRIVNRSNQFTNTAESINHRQFVEFQSEFLDGEFLSIY